MSIRYSTSLLGLCLATAAAGLLSPAAAQQWVLPRTPDGHPDLQGNWTNATLTPLQRPAGWAPVLTWEKASEIETGQAELVALTNAPSEISATQLKETGIRLRASRTE